MRSDGFMERRGFFWNTLGHYSEVIRDERGDLHAVLATRETGGVGMTSPLMHVRTGPHGTHVTELPGLSRGGSGYPSLAASADGRLWLASIGAGEIDGVRYSSNTLFIQHSPDGGGTWSTPATVRGVEDSFVADARIVHAAGDTLHMVWSEMAEPPLRSGLLHAVSSDGGSTWSDPERVPVASGWNVNRPILTATARGGVHLTYTVITGGSEPDVNLWQNVFVDGEFAPPQRIENDSARIVHNFGYLIDDSGRQHLVWTHHQKPPHPELGFRDQRMSYTFREACVGPAQH